MSAAVSYLVQSISDFDDVDHAFMCLLLEKDELSASYQSDVSSTVADNQVCDDLVARQIIDTSDRCDVTGSVVVCD